MTALAALFYRTTWPSQPHNLISCPQIAPKRLNIIFGVQSLANQFEGTSFVVTDGSVK